MHFFLAPPCVSCGATLDHPLDGPVCEICWRAVPAITPPWCVQCGDAAPFSAPFWRCARCRRKRPEFSIARSAGRYEGTLRDIVHAYKYGRCRFLASPLGALMRHAGADTLTGADVVIPVPLHPWRLLSRGFNQADDLAHGLGVPIWRALYRRRHRPPQAALPAARRHQNVRGAFAVRSCWHAGGRLVRTSALRGAIVVLIDDVMTTGATISACAEQLKGAGVSEVRALTVARAVTRRPPPLGLPRHPSSLRRR